MPKTKAILMGCLSLAAFLMAGRAQAQVRVPGFLPSTNGFHFNNAWPDEPDVLINAGIFTIPIGSASNGLCGGMVFAVRDFFEAGDHIPANPSNPADGSTLFNYIFSRLIDSFNLPNGFFRYYALQALTSDFERAQRIIMDWPLIKQDLDGGHLSPMGLIRVRNDGDVTKLGENHQVLAWGYDLSGPLVTLHIYDPNHADNDTVTLIFDSLTGVGPTQSTGETLFSFMHIDYSPKTPQLQAINSWSNGFEGAAAASWFFSGIAGVDVNRGNFHTGLNNGWARATSGWNSVDNEITTLSGSTCTVSAWIRSTTVDAYMSIRSNLTGAVINEVHITGIPDGGYHHYSFDYFADSSTVLFYTGLWGNGADTWLQVDDVSSVCRTW